MTPRTALARRRRVVGTALDRRLLQVSRRLAAGSITLRDATAEVYAIHTRQSTLDAHHEARHMPKPLADAYIIAAAAKAHLEVETDRPTSETALAVAERRLGEVLVLPCGGRVGPQPAPAKEPAQFDPRELW